MRSDTFFGQKAPAAIRTLLNITKQPQTIPQIVEALKNHGYNSAAQDLYNNLYTALLRMEGKDTVRKLPDGRWGLAEWYPGSAKRKKAEAAKQGPADSDEDEDETTAA